MPRLGLKICFKIKIRPAFIVDYLDASSKSLLKLLRRFKKHPNVNLHAFS